MRKIDVITVLFLFGVLFQGCEVEEMTTVEGLKNREFNMSQSISVMDVSPWDFNFKEKSVTVNEYEIVFNGREFRTIDGSIFTIFNYTVRGNGATAQADSFYLEIPGCAGDNFSWTPTQSAKLEGNMLKWNKSISKDGSQDFSVTFQGEIDYGVIEAIIVRGGIEETELVVGPCAGIYELKGYVFVDANEDGKKQASESGIEGYTVVLEQGVNSAEVVTDSDGVYSFKVIPGNYDVSIKNNPLGEEYYAPYSSKKQGVTVPYDLSADFGYKAMTAKMTEDFSDGDIILTTASAKEWGQQIKMAGKNNSSFTKAQVLEMLGEVEDLLLQDPYPFKFGNNKIQTALDILSKPIKTDEDLFMQQLLAAELNVVNGRGAVDSDGNFRGDFNYALLKYAEAKALGETVNAAGALMTSAATSRSYSLSSTSLLSSFNDNGSGGL